MPSSWARVALALAALLLVAPSASHAAPIGLEGEFEAAGAFNEAPASGGSMWKKTYPGLGPPAFLSPGAAAGPLSDSCKKWSWTRYARVGRAVDLQVGSGCPMRHASPRASLCASRLTHAPLMVGHGPGEEDGGGPSAQGAASGARLTVSSHPPLHAACHRGRGCRRHDRAPARHVPVPAPGVGL